MKLFFKKGRETVPLGVVKIIAVLHSIPFWWETQFQSWSFYGCVYSMSAHASGKVLERRMCRLFLIRKFPPFLHNRKHPLRSPLVSFKSLYFKYIFGSGLAIVRKWSYRSFPPTADRPWGIACSCPLPSHPSPERSTRPPSILRKHLFVSASGL